MIALWLVERASALSTQCSLFGRPEMAGNGTRH